MKLLLAFSALALVATPTIAGKITCRNAKGQIAKASECPPNGTKVAVAGGKISAPDKTGRCHIEVPAPGTKQKKGQFATCPK